MPILISQGNEIYTIAKEVFSKSYVYNFSTKHVVNVDLFVRLNKDEKFNEKNFLIDLINVFNKVKYPTKNDLKTLTKNYGLIIEGVNYNQMHPGIKKLIQKALERGYKVEYAYNGVNVAKRGILIEFKRYDPNLDIFMKVFLNVNGQKKKWVGRDIVNDYDKILEELEKQIENF